MTSINVSINGEVMDGRLLWEEKLGLQEFQGVCRYPPKDQQVFHFHSLIVNISPLRSALCVCETWMASPHPPPCLLGLVPEPYGTKLPGCPNGKVLLKKQQQGQCRTPFLCLRYPHLSQSLSLSLSELRMNGERQGGEADAQTQCLACGNLIVAGDFERERERERELSHVPFGFAFYVGPLLLYLGEDVEVIEGLWADASPAEPWGEEEEEEGSCREEQQGPDEVTDVVEFYSEGAEVIDLSPGNQELNLCGCQRIKRSASHIKDFRANYVEYRNISQCHNITVMYTIVTSIVIRIIS
ncbi:hypothetical protein L3Q82_004488 [Scortum barcoo]|uniref:Uncharacterized protein n=1 Tax=Scortum barcoo TaxID=214431 RepID=A0ACB8VKD7_9TELE|nr:hypothetical protein L3Q82_004488 [Scortum barcoo]